MRYTELTENYETINRVSEIVDFIKENCQPYLRENPGLVPMWRGMKNHNAMAAIRDTNKARRPKDIQDSVTRVIDQALTDIGSKALRTNSFFTTGNFAIATDYGHEHVVYPIGNYNYTWSLEVNDMFSVIKRPGLRNYVQVIDEHLLEVSLENFVHGRVMQIINKLAERIEQKLSSEGGEDLSQIKKAARQKAEEIVDKKYHDMVKKFVNKTAKQVYDAYEKDDLDTIKKLEEKYHFIIKLNEYDRGINPEKLYEFVKENFIVDEQLVKAINSGNEILMTCDKYLIVDYKIEPDVKRKLLGKL